MNPSLPGLALSAANRAMGAVSMRAGEDLRDREKTASPPVSAAPARETALFQHHVAAQRAAAMPAGAVAPPAPSMEQQRKSVRKIILASIEKFQVPGPAQDTLQTAIEHYTKNPKVFEFLRRSLGKNIEENSCLEKIAQELVSTANFLNKKLLNTPLARAALRIAVEDRLKGEMPQIAADIQKASPTLFRDFMEDYKKTQGLRYKLSDFYIKLIQLPREELCYLVEVFEDAPISVTPQDATLTLLEELHGLLDLQTPHPQVISRQILDGFRYVISEFFKEKAAAFKEEKKVVPFEEGVERVLSYYIPYFLKHGENREQLFTMVEKAEKSIEVFEIHQVDMGESDEANCCLEQMAFRIAEAAEVRGATPFSVASRKAAIRAVARTLLLPAAPKVVATLKRNSPSALQHLVTIYQANSSLRKKLWKAFNGIKRLPDQQLQLLFKRKKEVEAVASNDLDEKTIQVMAVVEQLLEQKPHSPIQESILEGFDYSIKHYFHEKEKEFSAKK